MMFFGYEERYKNQQTEKVAARKEHLESCVLIHFGESDNQAFSIREEQNGRDTDGHPYMNVKPTSNGTVQLVYRKKARD